MLQEQFSGPCQWWNDLVWRVDCTRPSTSRVLFALSIPLGALALLYLIHSGKIKKTERITHWMRELENRKVTELTDGELIIFATVTVAVLLLTIGVAEGFSSLGALTFLVCSSIYVCFFVWRAAKRQEEKDPHKDIPAEVRAMSEEELKKHIERLRLLNQTRALMGEQQSDIPQKVDKLKRLKDLKARLKQEDPDMEGDIDLLIEMERIRELEKNK